MRDPDMFLSPEHFWFGDLNVYNDIHNERVRAHRKHDSNGDSMERKEFTDSAWLSVLVEEVGEVARAMCDHRHHGEFADPAAFAVELRDELVQVAAMATAWIDAIELDERYIRRGAPAPESGARHA